MDRGIERHIAHSGGGDRGDGRANKAAPRIDAPGEERDTRRGRIEAPVVGRSVVVGNEYDLRPCRDDTIIERFENDHVGDGDEKLRAARRPDGVDRAR